MMELELEHDGLDGGRVLGWMVFPTDPAMRAAHFNRELVRQKLTAHPEHTSVTLSTTILAELLNGPSQQEIRTASVEATKRGTVAGDLLSLIYRRWAQGLEEPSLRKAIEDYKNFAVGKTYGDGEALKYSPQKLRDYFVEFLPVAHLWAAFRLNQGPERFTENPSEVFHEQSALMTMLGVAKAVGEFATTFIPLRTSPPKPVIAPEALLTIPNEVPAVRLSYPEIH